MRSAIVVARGGPLGAAQTLATLESLASSWSSAIADWNVVLLAPKDRDLQNLVSALGGQVDVRWDGVDVARARQEAARSGRKAFVFLAGDFVEPVDKQLPRSVALFDGGESNDELTNSSSTRTIQPKYEWMTDPPLWARHRVAVYRGHGMPYTLTTRCAAKILWLSGADAHSIDDDSIRDVAEVVDLVVTDRVHQVAMFPRAVFAPRGGCLLSPAEQRITPKSARFSQLLVDVDDASVEPTLPQIGGRVDIFRIKTRTPEELRDAAEQLKEIRRYEFCAVRGRSYAPGEVDEVLVSLLRGGTTPITLGEGPLASLDRPGLLAYDDPKSLLARLEEAAAMDEEVRATAAARNHDVAAQWCSREEILFPHLAPYLETHSV